MTGNPTFWLLARATGLTAYALLTLAVLAGLTLRSRPFGKALRPAAVTDVHRALALAGLAATALHGLTLVADATVEISPLALVVPGLAPYRPVATALGVVAAEVMAVVYASFSLRRRIGVKAWRRLHLTTYLAFAAATAHGLAAGTDTPRLLGLYLGAAGAVATATAWRALAARPVPKGAVR